MRCGVRIVVARCVGGVGLCECVARIFSKSFYWILDWNLKQVMRAVGGLGGLYGIYICIPVAKLVASKCCVCFCV